jgi:hypothetical protein
MKISPRFKNVGLVVGGGAASLALAACLGFGNPTTSDLKNSPVIYPNFSATLLNVSGFPNITMLCYDGAGFATTTRDAAGAITLVPQWSAFCARQVGKQATQGGQP